jgi:iron complex outermembrane receptor protein
MAESRSVSFERPVPVGGSAWGPLLLLAAAGLHPGTTAAQGTPRPAGAGAADLQEIVVTARKRSESIQDAPLSVTAFSAEQLEVRGVQSLADVARFTPGLTFNQGTSRASSDFSIRGITQSSAPQDNRRDLVTVFLNGVPLIGTPAAFGVEDLERVEIIKGPQSALFGRATFGGAISLVTTTPGDELKGRVAVTGAQYGDYRVNASVEGPLLPGKLAARVVVDASEFDGFYRNAFGGRLGESSQRYYAGTLSFTPTEDVSVKVRYGRRDDEDGPAATALIARWPEHNCGAFPGFTPRPLAGLPPGFTLEQSRRAYCGELKAPGGTVGINTTLPAASLGRTKLDEHGTQIDQELWSGSAEWRFGGGWAVNAIASTQDVQVVQLADFERAPEDRYQAYSDIAQTQDTYELRLTSPAERRFQWMLGVSRLEATFDNLAAFINGSLFGATAGGPPLPLVPARNASETDSVFGSLGFDVTPQLNVAVEARRQWDTITSGIGTPTEFDVETPATLPRVLVRYELTDRTNVYANYARGNQPTQGYATYFQLTPAQQAIASANGVNPTAPEAEVENYELGIKHREPDNRWYANAAVFYMKWTGRQGVRSVQVDLNGDGRITNLPAPAGEVFNAVPFPAGDSNTKGLEIDGAYRLGANVSVGGSLAYADTEITKALNEPVPLRLFGITDSKGKLYPGAPELSGAAFAQYDGVLAASRDWYARADVTYVGKRYDNIVNLAYVPALWRTNLRAGLSGATWGVEAWVENLFDDDTLEASRYNSDSAADPFFFQLVASEAVLARKRQFGVTATFRF